MDAKRTAGGTLNGFAPGPKPEEWEREMYARLAGRYERTLLEACAVAGIAPPVSHDDLMRTYRTLRDRGIAHNMMYEPTWMEAIYGEEVSG